MTRYVTVESQLWRDVEFLRLRPDARLLFIWAWSNEKAQPSGLYTATRVQLCTAFAPFGYMAEPVLRGAALAKLDDALEELNHKPLMLYDEKHALVWVVNRARYANRNERTLAAIRRGWRQAPDSSPIKAMFRSYYRTLFTATKEAA